MNVDHWYDSFFSLTDANWSIQPVEADGSLADVQEVLPNDDLTAKEDDCIWNNRKYSVSLSIK